MIQENDCSRSNIMGRGIIQFERFNVPGMIWFSIAKPAPSSSTGSQKQTQDSWINSGTGGCNRQLVSRLGQVLKVPVGHFLISGNVVDSVVAHSDQANSQIVYHLFYKVTNHGMKITNFSSKLPNFICFSYRHLGFINFK